MPFLKVTRLSFISKPFSLWRITTKKGKALPQKLSSLFEKNVHLGDLYGTPVVVLLDKFASFTEAIVDYFPTTVKKCVIKIPKPSSSSSSPSSFFPTISLKSKSDAEKALKLLERANNHYLEHSAAPPEESFNFDMTQDANYSCYSEISKDLAEEVADIAETHILPLLSSSYPAMYDAEDGVLTMHCSEAVIMTISPSGFILLTDSNKQIQMQLNFRDVHEQGWDTKLEQFVSESFVEQLALDQKRI